MLIIRFIFRMLLLAIWLPIIGVITFFLQFGGWGGIKRATQCGKLWGIGICYILGVKIRVHGNRSAFKGGLIISNHVGLLDIPIHASIFPIRFASRGDLRHWPIFGWYLRVSRAIWIDRSSTQKSLHVAEQFKQTMEHGIPLLVYPEGTSSSGKEGLLPFKSTPFEAATKGDFPILPVLSFFREVDRNRVVAWYGDMRLLPHCMRLIGYRRIEVDIYILPVIHPAGRNRKDVAQAAHDLMEAEYWETDVRLNDSTLR
ncbi:MAG: 1-acyl-sn-glycerol-3-phosphate acyltransferase [Victivallaceae bacterium]|nr:1-acyl-sn-glycerol-3-phosphate acyltransferase [Victivallaceae bacterium]